jgi:predicted tellurium resistance membrane protein TerC
LPFDIIAYYPINSYVTRVILLFSLSWLLQMQLTIISLVCACLIYLC